MPGKKATAASNASKRVRTESARKREGRENAEALKRDRAGQKAAAKARKDLRDEAADDNLLVEREGESPEFTKLRVYTLQLESDNQRMKAKLTRRDERDDTAPVKIIPAPNKGDVDVELLRGHLGLLGEEHDVKWSLIRQDFRALLVAAGLDWDRPWSKQDVDHVNTLYHAAENRRPEMKRFANHWGTEFLLKESFGNLYFYHHKQANKHPTSTNANSTTRDSHTDVRDDDHKSDNEAQKDDTRRAAAHKAAAHRAAERKAGKRKADTQDDDERDNRKEDNDAPFNDGETETEDLPDETRKAIEREEIGVSGSTDLRLPTKTTAKVNRARPENSVPLTSSMSTPKARNDTPNPASGSKFNRAQPDTPASSTSTPKGRADTVDPASGSKLRPVIYMKRGRGGCGGRGGRGGRGRAPVTNVSHTAPSARDDEVLSSSSGQTTSGSETD